MSGRRILWNVPRWAGWKEQSRRHLRSQRGSLGHSVIPTRAFYRPEGDYLEVIFDQKPGYFRETASDQVMEKVDDHGNILGFSVLKVSSVREAPLEVAL